MCVKRSVYSGTFVKMTNHCSMYYASLITGPTVVSDLLYNCTAFVLLLASM